MGQSKTCRGKCSETEEAVEDVGKCNSAIKPLPKSGNVSKRVANSTML